MTVSVAQNLIIYDGDGETVEFPAPAYQVDSDITVLFRQANGASTTLVLGTHYTLARLVPAGETATGTLTVIDGQYVPDRVSEGTRLVIFTDIPATQQRAFPLGGELDTRELERALDKLTMLVQGLSTNDLTAVHAPEGDLAGDMVLPPDVLRSGQIFSFGPTGLPLLMTPEALANLLEPMITGETVSKTTVLSREEIGLTGDGVTDDAPQLNAKILEYSNKGGATFYLQPADGANFYFGSSIRNRSFVQLVFVGPPVELAKGATLGIRGDVALDPATNRYRLVSDASLDSDTVTIDTAPQGGGAVSTKFATGDRIVIEGEVDAAGNVTQRSDHKITAINDTLKTLTVDPVLPYAYELAYDSGAITLIAKKVQGLLTVDAAERSNLAVVEAAAFSRLALNDYVLMESDAICSQAGGGSSERTHLEIVQIVRMGEDGANTLTFNRRLERTYAVADGARVTLLDPAVRATITGASVVFTEAPDPAPAARVPTFEIQYGAGCSMLECEVPNEDAFGSRGAMFRVDRSIDCTFVRPSGRNPKALTGGDGVGLEFAYATGCSAIEPSLAGCRYNLAFAGATLCHGIDIVTKDDRAAAVKFMAQNETGCSVSLRNLAGGSKTVLVDGSRTALQFGDETNRVGPRRCVVEGGRIGNYRGLGSRVVQFVPGADECVVKGVQCDDVQTLLWHEDLAAAATLVASGCSIEECVVNGHAGRLVDIDGGRNGSSTKTLSRLTLRDVRSYGGSQQYRIVQADRIRIRDCSVDDVVVDLTEPYAVAATDVTGLSVQTSSFTGCGAGMALGQCPAFRVLRNDFIDQVGSTVVVQDNGGNTDGQWRYNDAIGFLPTKDEQSPSSGLIEYPLPMTPTADYVRLT